MDGKLEQIQYKGIERNSAEESATLGSAQELFNMRYKDGAWRNVKRKLKLGEYASTRKFIGWYSHPATDNQTFIAYNEDARKVAVINYVTDSQTWIVKRDGTDFVLPANETFNRFGHLENVLILFSNVQMYRFLWINGKFEYVEFGDIEWTCEKGDEQAFLLDDTTEELVIGKYLETRNNDLKIGYIEGICAFRIVVELFDNSFVWYSDIKILRGTGQTFSELGNIFTLNSYENKLYVPEATDPCQIVYSSYRPKITFTVPEWFEYYNRLGLVKAIHVCATRPIYPFIPAFASGLWWNSGSFTNSGGVLVQIWSLLPETKPAILFPDETNVFYSLYAVTDNQPTAPTATQAFDFSDIVTEPNRIQTDNFTGNKTTSIYNFNYNSRLHMEQIINTLQTPFKPLVEYFPNYDSTTTPGTWIPVEPDDYVVTAGYDMYAEYVINVNNNYVLTRVKLTDTYKIAIDTATEASIWVGRFIHYPNVSAKFMRITFSSDGENFYTQKNPSYKLNTFAVSALNIAKNKTSAELVSGFTPALYSDYDVHTVLHVDPIVSYYNLLFLHISVPPAGTDYATSPLCELVTEIVGTYNDTNRLQLSELENPFVLPASSSYRFGDINNRISGIEVPREQLSETRFGQFPLYVNTTQGIWVLEQGTDVTYSNSYYLDKYICDNNNLIKAIQGFVVFSTADGLYIVSGRSFQELSTAIEGSIDCHIPQANLDALQSLFLDGVGNSYYLSLLEFKAELPYMIMCFDYINKEIIFSMGLAEARKHDKEINYSYVYSLESKSWHKISESFAYFVDTNPAVVGIKYNKELGIKETFIHTYSFFDMHAEDEYNDAKMYISRPVTFGSMIYKRLEQIVVRMNLENLHKDIQGNYVKSPYNFYIFGSLDGKEYKLLQGGETIVSYLNDISLRRMFVDCKFFIFAYVCTHEQVEMLGIEAVVKPKFIKTMR